MTNIGMIKANYGHKGDLAIVRGTLNTFKELNFKVNSFIDPDISMPADAYDDISIMRSWPSILQQNVISGQGIRKRAYIESLHSYMTWKPEPFDLDYIWYLGGVRFGAMAQKYAIMELVYALFCKDRFKRDLIFGGISITRREDPLSKLYTKILHKRGINKIDFIFTRDTRTFEFLKKQGFPENKLSFICDFSFHLNHMRTDKTELIAQSIKEFEQPIGIIADTSMLKRVGTNFDNERFNRVLKLIKSLKNERFSIFLIPLSNLKLSNPPPYTQDDREACNEINKKLGCNFPIIDTNDLLPEEIIEIMTSLSAIISIGRLHGAALGCLANIPTFHVYFEEKALMFKDYFEDFPLFWYKDWMSNVNIDNEIIKSIQSYEAMIYDKKINLWRNRAMNEIKRVMG